MIDWLAKARTHLAHGAVVIAIAGSTICSAQTGSHGTASQAGLDMPANLQIFGKPALSARDSSVIVNGVAITRAQVDERTALVMAANGLAAVSTDDMAALKRQVWRALIDETLEIEHAKASGTDVGADEIDHVIVEIAANFGKQPGEFSNYLRTIGSSDRSLRQLVEGGMVWRRLLLRRPRSATSVEEGDVQAVLERLKQFGGGKEYHLMEIHLPATPASEPQVFAQERQMIEAIQTGTKPFEFYAQSSAPATQPGGDLGWLSEDQIRRLPNSLAAQARIMKVGEIAGPIAVSGGYSILWLRDTRRTIEGGPRDARLGLKQIKVKTAGSMTEADVKARLQDLASATQSIHGCGDVSRVAAASGADVIDKAETRAGDLPAPLEKIMLELRVGEASPPFGSTEDGFRSLIVCGRDEGPDLTDEILRDLRRKAVIEYR